MAFVKHGATFGRTQTKTWRVWRAMRRRCVLGSSSSNRYYIDRGIKVCDRWSEFANFLADMGECPVGMSIDRVDPDGHYCPENCRWATPAEQIHGRRDIKLSPDRVRRLIALSENHTRKELATMFNISYATVVDIILGRRWSSITGIGGLAL